MWMTLAQADPLGIASFTQYGIVGILGTVIFILMRFIYKQTDRAEARSAEQSRSFLDFAEKHRGELSQSMRELGATMVQSTEKLTAAIAAGHHEVSSVLDKQVRRFDEVIITNGLVERLRELKASGVNLSQDEADRILRAAINERKATKGE